MLSTCHLVLKLITGKLKPRYVGPFQVEAQMVANTFKLILLSRMRIHPVFNVSLLQPYQGVYKPSRPIEVEGQAKYKVEKNYITTMAMVEVDNTL